MDILQDIPLELALPLLALIDGTSAGTLVIPILLLLMPGRVQWWRIALYLGTITLFYFVVGVLMSFGVVNLATFFQETLSPQVSAILRLVFGAVLLIVAFALPGGRKKAQQTAPVPVPAMTISVSQDPLLPPPAPAPAAPQPSESWWQRKRATLFSALASPPAVMGIAVLAGLTELVTMLPYLGAMALMAEQGVSDGARVLWVGGYCLMMIVPVTVIILVRAALGDRVTTALQKLADAVKRFSGGETMAWILGIVGFMIARSGYLTLVSL